MLLSVIPKDGEEEESCSQTGVERVEPDISNCNKNILMQPKKKKLAFEPHTV
jgi:hypothetical protein